MGDIKEFVHSIKTDDQRIWGLIEGIREPYEKFLKNVKNYKQNKDEKSRNLAEEFSRQIFGDLMRIVDIAKKTNDQTTINLVEGIMQLVKDKMKELD